jgi:dihydrofolate reductase
MRLGKKITIIAAMARNRAIGLDGTMPWHLPAELRHFKQSTMGRPIVMGRKTWESIGRPLPGRQNIVVTSNDSLQAPGCEIATSLDLALAMAEGEEVMIIGGGQLYQQSLEFTDCMILTVVDIEPEGDTWFPDWNTSEWRQISSRQEAADERNPFAYRVSEWVRKRGVCDTSREPGTPAGPQA